MRNEKSVRLTRDREDERGRREVREDERLWGLERPITLMLYDSVVILAANRYHLSSGEIDIQSERMTYLLPIRGPPPLPEGTSIYKDQRSIWSLDGRHTCILAPSSSDSISLSLSVDPPSPDWPFSEGICWFFRKPLTFLVSPISTKPRWNWQGFDGDCFRGAWDTDRRYSDQIRHLSQTDLSYTK